VVRSSAKLTAFFILALIATMVGVGAAAGDFCADGGGTGTGCAQPCHISCPDGCANTTLLAEPSLPAPTSRDDVRWCAPLDVGITIAPPDFQPPRISTV